ncbi:MAG: hypothetical protein ABWW65_06055 [Thermoprotei archaeon]
MAIRLRLRLRRNSKSIDVVALVNSGYETLEPELLVPSRIAEELGLLPVLPPGSMVKEYILADGSITRLVKIHKAVKVSVIEEDRVVSDVEASIVISDRADEVLISDKLAGKLGIVALDFAEG